MEHRLFHLNQSDEFDIVVVGGTKDTVLTLENGFRRHRRSGKIS
jgi:hypothetical protein